MDNLLCLCDVWKGCRYLNANVFVSSMFNKCQFYVKYYFLHHRNSPWKRFNYVLIAKSLFSFFIHQNTKSNTGLNTYSILEERLKVLLKMFLLASTEMSSRHHLRAYCLKCIFSSLCFQYWLRKSMDWFLYDNGLRHERFNGNRKKRLLSPLFICRDLGTSQFVCRDKKF